MKTACIITLTCCREVIIQEGMWNFSPFFYFAYMKGGLFTTSFPGMHPGEEMIFRQDEKPGRCIEFQPIFLFKPLGDSFFTALIWSYFFQSPERRDHINRRDRR